MAAAINFYAGADFAIQDLEGSGLGMYGSDGFGTSVRVGYWNGRTFITNGAGTTQGAEVANVQYLNTSSGVLGQAGSGIALTCIPNYQSTLNIRFTNDSAVQALSPTLRIFDRVNADNSASGVTTKVAEIIHPGITQANSGSGDTAWVTPNGSGVTLSAAPSPGISGLYAGNGSNSTRSDTRHDWYFALSASPDSIGSKQMWGLYFSCEFL